MPKYSKNLLLSLSIGALLALFLPACITPPPSTRSQWEQLSTSSQFLTEKEIYNQRLKGKKLCTDVGVANFTYNSNLKPDPACIYPAVMIAKDRDGDRYWTKSLRVVQVLNNGFLVTSPSMKLNIFIHRTDEKGVIDDMYLASDPHEYRFYEYTGTYTYSSLVGNRTIHSFRSYNLGDLNKAYEGLTTYYFLQDAFAQAELWDWVAHWGMAFQNHLKKKNMEKEIAEVQ